MLDDRWSFPAAHALSEEIEGEIGVLPNADVIVHAEPFEEEIPSPARAPRAHRGVTPRAHRGTWLPFMISN